MRLYHFDFFCGPPLSSKMMLSSPMMMSVICALSPGCAVAPYLATSMRTVVSSGPTVPSFSVSPCLPSGNERFTKTYSACRPRMRSMRDEVVSCLLKSTGGAGGRAVAVAVGGTVLFAGGLVAAGGVVCAHTTAASSKSAIGSENFTADSPIIRLNRGDWQGAGLLKLDAVSRRRG